jgi:hypothetical protein
MDIYVKNTEQGLIPLYEDDLEEKKKLKIGEVYKVNVVKPRNYQFLKKFMALIKIGCENSKNVDMPVEVYRKYATMKAGFVDIYTTPKGKFADAQSIAFANMAEDEFQEVYNRVLDFIVEDTHADRDLIERELISFF